MLFEEDFEQDLAAWSFPHRQGSQLIDSDDRVRGRVLSLQTQDRLVIALIEGSEEWGDIRLTGEVLFPEEEQNYLGLIYRYNDEDGRADFGSLYIKGNGSYIRANPYFALNIGRTLYE